VSYYVVRVNFVTLVAKHEMFLPEKSRADVKDITKK